MAAKNHTVQLGDCIASLSDANGFGDYKTVYDDGANAALKASRPNANVLAAGDTVVIPEVVPKAIPLPTGKTHTLVVAKITTVLRIVIQDHKGTALAGLPYELKVGASSFAGNTPADGKIEHPVPPGAKAGTLQLWKKQEPGIDGYLFPLELGSLEHESVDRACQARLLNLGFDCGGTGGAVDARTHEALRGFQKGAGLPENGNLT